MCGIVAYLGLRGAAKYIHEGLSILQNRGYDSAGICTLQTAELHCTKVASRPEQGAVSWLAANALESHGSSGLGIGHTRWATHGAKTDANAHPHLDASEQIAVVHNGIIENYAVLKSSLIAAGCPFVSETDTEVVANLIAYELKAAGGDIRVAIKAALQQLEGTWGLAILYVGTPDTLYLAKNGSPLLIGHDDTAAIVASEASGFSNYMKNYIILQDHEFVAVSRSATGALMFHRDAKGDFKRGRVESEVLAITPDPYPHWMLKEIWEQPASIQRAINMGGRLQGDAAVRLGGLNAKAGELLEIDHLVILACGTSYHAGLYGSRLLRWLQCFQTVQVIDASEFTIYDLPPTRTGILVLSQSGETKDVHRALQMAREHDIFIFSLVNVVGSLIAREADCGMYLNAGREVAVASTKAFTSQVVGLAMVGVWFAQNRALSPKRRVGIVSGVRNLSSMVQQVLDGLDETVDPIAEKIGGAGKIFILGRYLGESVAYEGALKIKEVSYIHAEGYCGGGLKHGPFALIEEGTPIILLIFGDEYESRMMSAAEEVASRGAHVVAISPLDLAGPIAATIPVPDAGEVFTPLLASVVLQYLAYKLSISRGLNPDMPRNLAKVVTVDG